MTVRDDWARQSAYSDPGRHAALLDALPAQLPAQLPALAAVVRNLLVHYRAHGLTFTGQRLAEIDHRWVERILATDQRRFGVPLHHPRPKPERVVGCCRDYTLLTVAALRHHGVPARSRVGFCGYFRDDFHNDHVIVEYWNGRRWVLADAELDPPDGWPFDPGDLPRGGPRPPFTTAAQAWLAFRRGEVDIDRYGVDPALPVRGGWFVRNYVLQELAHRQRDELLLWDMWGVMSDELDGDLDLVDEVAALLLAADGGDQGAERELADRYADDERLRPGTRVDSYSPTGTRYLIDLGERTATGVGECWTPVGGQDPIAIRS